MEFKEVRIEDIQHEHPLILVDLQLMYQNYEEDDDDFEDADLIACQNFKCLCDMCGSGIDWYHRFYYKCSESCNYSLHKCCAEMSTTLRFPAHPTHILILNKVSNEWTCHACCTKHQYGMCYLCSACNYQIDLRCFAFVEENTIHHPGHPHPLVYFAIDPILCKCFACGKKHEGFFYHCTTCFNFSIHTDCVTLPIKFLLQNHHFSHPHMLTLSYSFSVILYGCKCRICGMNISYECWLYKCSKCLYYVHLDCATSRGEPFMSIFSTSIGKTNKNFEAVDYPHLLHFPLPDESYHILPHQILREKNYQYLEQIRNKSGYFKHSSHNHPLVLVDMENNNDTTERKSICFSTTPICTSRMSLHNPGKRIKLLCNGCMRPVTTMPYYKCSKKDKGCDFCLHEWCTRLPTTLQNHPGHPQHTLVLCLDYKDIYTYYLSPFEPRKFKCSNCRLPCNGFAYVCSECRYCIDVHCGFIPENITHEAHLNHLLSRVHASSILSTIACHTCHAIIDRREICFRCNACDFYLDSRCAMHLPKTIRHKYDKHSLKLSYSPIENHKSQYFCEICEEDLNPGKWFYHCLECRQSIHSACAPLILKSEQDVNSLHVESVYMFVNMKLGATVNFQFHRHPLSYVAGTKSDGDCLECRSKLQSSLIGKCSECNYAIHTNCGWSAMGLWKSKHLKRYEHEEKLQRQIAVTFYPSGSMRPVTGHWKSSQ